MLLHVLFYYKNSTTSKCYVKKMNINSRNAYETWSKMQKKKPKGKYMNGLKCGSNYPS